MFERIREALRRKPNREKPAAGALSETALGDGTDRAAPSIPDVNRLGLQAATLVERGDYLQALALYEKALSLAPNDGALWADKARAREFLGDFAGARECFDRAEHCDPTLELSSERGRLCLSEDRFAEALELLDLGLQREPNKASTWHNKACALYGLGRLAEAITCLDRVVALNPRHAMAARMRVVIEQAMRRADSPEGQPAPATLSEASEALNRALARAQTARQAGHLDQAEAALREAVSLCPQHPTIWHNLGNVLQDKGQFAEAVACYELELELDRSSAVGWSCKANALARLAFLAMATGAKDQVLRGQLAEVMRCHHHAVSLAPEDAQCWMNQGAFLIRIHLRAQAIESFVSCSFQKETFVCEQKETGHF